MGTFRSLKGLVVFVSILLPGLLWHSQAFPASVAMTPAENKIFSQVMESLSTPDAASTALGKSSIEGAVTTLERSRSFFSTPGGTRIFNSLLGRLKGMLENPSVVKSGRVSKSDLVDAIVEAFDGAQMGLPKQAVSTFTKLARAAGLITQDGAKMVDGAAYAMVDEINRVGVPLCAGEKMSAVDRVCQTTEAVDWILQPVLHPLFSRGSQSLSCQLAMKDFETSRRCRGSLPDYMAADKPFSPENSNKNIGITNTGETFDHRDTADHTSFGD